MAYSRGDVILTAIPFTNLAGVKARPAVVLSSDTYNQGTPDLMVASLTSNLNAVAHPGDHPLADWQAAGLPKPSLVQAKLTTVSRAMVVRRLGSLAVADLAAVENGIRTALGL